MAVRLHLHARAPEHILDARARALRGAALRPHRHPARRSRRGIALIWFIDFRRIHFKLRKVGRSEMLQVDIDAEILWPSEFHCSRVCPVHVLFMTAGIGVPSQSKHAPMLTGRRVVNRATFAHSSPLFLVSCPLRALGLLRIAASAIAGLHGQRQCGRIWIRVPHLHAPQPGTGERRPRLEAKAAALNGM